MSSTIINEVTYSYSGTSASVVACTTISNLSVVIPSTITVASTTYNVVSIGSAAFSSRANIVSCSIPSSVTSIGASAFLNCSNITSTITIPAGVTTLEASAFQGCSKVPTFLFANSNTIKSIGDYAFHTCSALISIAISSNVTNIGIGAFQNCSNLTSSIIIPTGVSIINGSLFSGCGKIPSVTFASSNTVTLISPYAFYQMSALTYITIPTSVTSIGSGAYSGCSNLTSITIPSGLTSIGNGAFALCMKLTSAITIPSGVTSLGYNTFGECRLVPSITFASPNTLKSIANSVFYNCYTLTAITIPSSVTSIGPGSFQMCSSLSRVSFLHTISTPTIGSNTFGSIASPSTAYVYNDVNTTSITGIFTSIFYLTYTPPVITPPVTTVTSSTASSRKLDVFLMGFTDIQRNIGTIGTFSGDYASYTGLSKYDANLYYGADLSTWQSCMKFATDGSIDVQQESVTLYFYKHPGLLGKSGLTNASSYSTANTGIYQVNNDVTVLPDKSNVVYTKNKVTDFSASMDYPDDPAAGLNFLKLLAKGVFGSVQAVDMFSNENELAIDYGLTVESCFNYCNTLISEDASGNTTTGSSNSIRFIQTVFSYMMSLTDVKARFDMTYKAAVTTGTFTTGTDIAVKLNGVATLGKVDVFMDGNNIIRIGVKTSTNASTFAKGNVVTIEKSGAVITITLNSVQAAMLNGKLNEPTELPLEAGDTFHINMYPRNNSNQMTAANKLLEINTSNRVVQSCDVHVQMVA